MGSALFRPTQQPFCLKFCKSLLIFPFLFYIYFLKGQAATSLGLQSWALGIKRVVQLREFSNGQGQTGRGRSPRPHRGQIWSGTVTGYTGMWKHI